MKPLDAIEKNAVAMLLKQRTVAELVKAIEKYIEEREKVKAEKKT